jgi:hypothetical protein
MRPAAVSALVMTAPTSIPRDRLITMFGAIRGFGARQTSWEDYRWMVNHGRFSFFRLMYPLG